MLALTKYTMLLSKQLENLEYELELEKVTL